MKYLQSNEHCYFFDLERGDFMRKLFGQLVNRVDHSLCDNLLEDSSWAKLSNILSKISDYYTNT